MSISDNNSSSIIGLGQASISNKLRDQLVSTWICYDRGDSLSKSSNDASTISQSIDAIMYDRFIKLEYWCTNDSSPPTNFLSMIFQVVPSFLMHSIHYGGANSTILLDTSQAISLHPQVEKFLVSSAAALDGVMIESQDSCLSEKDGLSEKDDIRRNDGTLQTSDCHHDYIVSDTNSATVTIHIAIPALQTLTPYRPTILSKTFQIHPIVQPVRHISNENPFHLDITLEFITSSHESYTQMFHSLFSSSSTLLIQHTHKNQNYITSLVTSRLQGRLIQPNTCIAISIPWILGQNHIWEQTSYCSVFFYIASTSHRPILLKSNHHDDVKEETDTSYYYIESTQNINIQIQLCRSSTTSTMDEEDNPTAVPKIQTCYPFTFTTCPGYESLLNELLSLTRIHSTIASPTAILLMGCHGVGKTRLVSTFLNHLIKESDDSFTTLHLQYISANDLVLATSAFTSMEEWIHQMFPNLPLNQNEENSKTNISSSLLQLNSRIALIVDDLDILYDEDHQDTSTTSSQDYGIRLALHAITQVMDRILSLSTSVSQIPLILGISSRDHITQSNVLVRVGRFEKILYMSPPTEYQRQKILERLLSDLPLLPLENKRNDIEEENIEEVMLVWPNSKEHALICNAWAKILASQTAGCVAADMNRIRVDAITRAMSRNFRSPKTSLPTNNSCGIQDRILQKATSPQNYAVTWEDVKESARNCIPSQLADLDVSIARTWDDNTWYESNTRESWKRLFEVSWACFGGYQEMKERLYRTVIRPWRASFNESQGSDEGKWKLSPPTGVLFHGPSGTGKSLAAVCLASSLSLNIIKVRASDVLDKWLGGSEAIVRSIFARARSAAPCILLFDDIESISSNRENDGDGGSSDVYSRVLSTLLNEMDGVSSGIQGTGEAILVVATSNRMEDIDAALLRPGRLDVHVNIHRPRVCDAMDIFRICLSKVQIHSDVDLLHLAEKVTTLDATGANIEGICEQACMNAIDREEAFDGDNESVLITMGDFEEALHRSLLCNVSTYH